MKVFYFTFFLVFVFFNLASAQTTVVLNWTDTSNSENGFGIQRAVGAGAFDYLAGVSVDVETYSDSTVQASTTYSYRLYAYNSYGNSTYSNTVQVTINSQGTGASSPSSGGSGGGGGGGSSSGSSSGGSSGGLTASVIPTPNASSSSPSSSSGSGSSEPNSQSNIGSLAGRAIDGDLGALNELNPVAVYLFLAGAIGILFFVVVWKYMSRHDSYENSLTSNINL